jgi:hypothetical protein
VDEIKNHLIVFVLGNWDTIAAILILGGAVGLQWLKKRAAEDGLGIVVTAVEGFHKSPPPVKTTDTEGLSRVKSEIVRDSMAILKRRIESVSAGNPAAATAIEKQVRIVDPK